ncbi:MAG: ORF6N domain-containing protein [Bacteroidales bacterium]|nr:ORF6N domain-containing protein [Bacteroidales bacterium]
MESLQISNAIVATSSNELNTLQEIEDRIFCIRGVQVMIDNDLADFYGVETKRLNEQVKRNIERFPERYMFQLTKEEQQYYYFSRSQIVTLKNVEGPLRSQFATLKNLKSQNATSSMRGKHSKYNSYAFTEQGVSMLASVLKSETAVQTSIKIIDAFVAMRHFMQKNAKLDKFNTQYPTITLNYTEIFHDRFLIIDTSSAYSIGSSVKDAGKRCFAVTQINEEWMVKMILEKISL